MVAHGINYTRVWHLLPWGVASTVFWPWAKGSQQACYEIDALNHVNGTRWKLTTTDATPGQTGTGTIQYPDNTYDHYWARMTGVDPLVDPQRGAIPYASDNCIASEVMLFDKSGMQRAGSVCHYNDQPPPPNNLGEGCNWTNHPFASDNNVNNFDLPPCALGNAGVPSFYRWLTNYNNGQPYNLSTRVAQEAYVRMLIDRTLPYNVIYEIENEHNDGGDSGAWAKYWGPFIKNYIGGRGPRLVSHSSLADYDVNTALTEPSIDVVNRHPADGGQNLTALSSSITNYWAYNKPINIDEFANGLTDPNLLRKMAWVIVTSGGHFHVEDIDPSITNNAFAIVSNIHAFLKERRWNFVGSKPNPTLSDQPYCMAPDPSAPGGFQDYVCYYTSATAGVTLHGLPAGQYYVRWWDPSTIPTFEGAYINHPGGDLHETPPYSPSSDWVLFVRNGASGPHEEPYDLAVTKDDGVAIIQPGQPLTYAIKVTNPGTADVSGVTVTDTFPAALQGVTWTCAAAGGAFCPASGSGNINQVAVDLPAGSSATFTATSTLSSTPPPPDPIANTATLTMPPGVTDPDLSSNSATDVDTTIGGSGAAFGFYTLTPCRVVDTRDLGAPIGGPALQAGQTRDFVMVGNCGIPSTAKALSLNVTVTQPTAQGRVRLAPPGISATSTVNFQAGDRRANNAIVSLVDGKLSARADGLAGSVHLIIDVNGYFQ